MTLTLGIKPGSEGRWRIVNGLESHNGISSRTSGIIRTGFLGQRPLNGLVAGVVSLGIWSLFGEPSCTYLRFGDILAWVWVELTCFYGFVPEKVAILKFEGGDFLELWCMFWGLFWKFVSF